MKGLNETIIAALYIQDYRLEIQVFNSTFFSTAMQWRPNGLKTVY